MLVKFVTKQGAVFEKDVGVIDGTLPNLYETLDFSGSYFGRKSFKLIQSKIDTERYGHVYIEV